MDSQIYTHVHAAEQFREKKKRTAQRKEGTREREEVELRGKEEKPCRTVMLNATQVQRHGNEQGAGSILIFRKQ